MFPVSLVLVANVVLVPQLKFPGGDGVCPKPCQPQLPAFPCSKGLYEGPLLCQLPELPDLLEGWTNPEEENMVSPLVSSLFRSLLMCAFSSILSAFTSWSCCSTKLSERRSYPVNAQDSLMTRFAKHEGKNEFC